MPLTRTGEYALRAVVFLAVSNADGPVATQTIADAAKISKGYLSKVMRLLTRAGLLRARRGIGGGFTLKLPPSEISVLDVLRAVDSQPERIDACPLGVDGHDQLCPLHRLLDQALACQEQAFAKTTIRDLAESTDGPVPMFPAIGARAVS